MRRKEREGQRGKEREGQRGKEERGKNRGAEGEGVACVISCKSTENAYNCTCIYKPVLCPILTTDDTLGA